MTLIWKLLICQTHDGLTVKYPTSKLHLQCKHVRQQLVKPHENLTVHSGTEKKKKKCVLSYLMVTNSHRLSSSNETESVRGKMRDATQKSISTHFFVLPREVCYPLISECYQWFMSAVRRQCFWWLTETRVFSPKLQKMWCTNNNIVIYFELGKRSRWSFTSFLLSSARRSSDLKPTF